MRTHSRLVLVLALAFLAVGVNVLAVADSPPTATVYSGCQNLTTGIVRLLPSRLPPPLNSTCLTGTTNLLLREKAISWNETGPAGLQGVPGPAGAQGPPGPAGAATIDALDATPCRVGTREAGVLHVTYAVGGAVSMTCVANATPTLTVTTTGPGTVTSTPAGIDCGSTCTHDFTLDQPVRLTATPTGTASFSGWSGACTGTGSCVVPMSGATSVTATFAPRRVLSVHYEGTTGAGTVRVDPGGVSQFLLPGETSTGALQFADATPVHLTATPSTTIPAGGSSVRWGGACSAATGTTCDLVLTADATVAVTFVAGS